jgi:hypothetical protein
MNARDKKLVGIRPDEWGFYNPDEAGVAAVIKRLGTRVRATTRKPVATAAKEPAKTVVATTAPVREPVPRKRKA